MSKLSCVLPHALFGVAVLTASAVSPGFARELRASGTVSAEAVGLSDPDRTESLPAWTQWRGPARDGVAPGASWPSSLEGLELLWSAELGKGYSGPVMSQDRIFVTETVDSKTEGARAFDRATGEEIWRVTWSGTGKVPFFAKRSGDWIRATPAYDGEALYVGGMEEVLHKLSATNGATLWTIDFRERFGTKTPDFGFASSPMVHEDALYVQAANSIVKLDRETGETLWRALENDGGMMSSGAFSSPVIADILGRPQLLVQTREVLYGLDPDSGEALWSQAVPSFRGMNILTPLVHGNQIFTSTHRNRSFLYEISQGPDGMQSTEVWNHKAQGYMSSPVMVGGTAFLHLGNGRLTAIDLETGGSAWTSTPYGSYWSLAVREEKILGLSSDGELFLLQASEDQAVVLDRAEVSDQSTWGHLAVSGEYLFVRELEGLRAFRLR